MVLHLTLGIHVKYLLNISILIGQNGPVILTKKDSITLADVFLMLESFKKLEMSLKNLCCI